VTLQHLGKTMILICLHTTSSKTGYKHWKNNKNPH